MRPKSFTLAPDDPDADGYAQAQAVGGAGNLDMVTGSPALVTGGVGTPDVPRTATIVSANAGDTTQTATFTGTDPWDRTISETVTLNGTTAVDTTAIFKTVTQIAMSASTLGNISAGTNDTLATPWYKVDHRQNPFSLSWLVEVTGTIGVKIQHTGEDPEDDTAPTAYTHPDHGTAATANDDGNYAYPVRAVRLYIESFSSGATVKATFIQSGPSND